MVIYEGSGGRVLLGEVASWVALWGKVKLSVNRLLSMCEGTVVGSTIAKMTA